MKRWSVLFLALALWALAGCGGPAADEGAAGEAPSVFAEAPAPDAEGGLSAVRLEGQARPLTDEEIQAAYFRAEEAYGWFSLETLPCGEKTQTIDGWLYYPVEYPGMENLADLRAYLRGLFSEELVGCAAGLRRSPSPVSGCGRGPVCSAYQPGAGRVQGSGGHPDQAVRPGGILCHSRGGSAGRRRLYR